jgi:hypothetical protein
MFLLMFLLVSYNVGAGGSEEVERKEEVKSSTASVSVLPSASASHTTTDPVISEQNIAHITTWKNNCAVSCASIFLIQAFLDQKLSEQAQKNLLECFNEYYRTSLNISQLRKLFETFIILPSDRQIVLGPVLRQFLISNRVEPEQQNMLSNQAFYPLATYFSFNVVFYADVDKKLAVSGAIPGITVAPPPKLVMRVYYARSHFELIMDTVIGAEKHNKSNGVISDLGLPIEREGETQLKAVVKGWAEIAVTCEK